MKVQHFAEVKIGYFKKVGFLFDMYALLESWADNEKGMDGLLYHAYRSYCKDKGKKVKYEKNQFRKLFDNVKNSDMKNLTKVMQEAVKDIQVIKQQAESELKKK